ncbi:MAG: V-type ATP synthase subunit K [Clostridia bacterium]|nr:V-type ATP synthase subunit K [Clostridia bacterium]
MEPTTAMTFAEVFNNIFLDGKVLAVLAAAIAAILPGMGSAKAVGSVGEALDGLMSEDPDKFGKGFLLQALPATQGIYGLIVAFMVFGQISAVSSGIEGLYLFGACLPIAFCGYYSAIRQGRVAAAGIATIAKQPSASGKTVITAAMVELYALLSLLISFLLVNQNPFVH